MRPGEVLFGENGDVGGLNDDDVDEDEADDFDTHLDNDLYDDLDNNLDDKLDIDSWLDIEKGRRKAAKDETRPEQPQQQNNNSYFSTI